MWNEELRDVVAYNPLAALERAQAGQSTIEGLVPRGGVTWLFGPSMSFKSFIVMSMAAAVSTGSSWVGRRTEPGVVIYVGAEGGDALHVRRAGAEMACAANTEGFVVVAQERPMLDSDVGAFRLRGVLSGVYKTLWVENRSPWAGAMSEHLASISAVRDASAALDEANRLWNEAVGRSKTDADAKAVRGAANEARRKARSAYDAACDEAEARDPRLKAYLGAEAPYFTELVLGVEEPPRNIFCIIDTYAQTAADDTRASVSAYIKNLRTLVEEARAEGFTLTFLVVDHVTKEGSTYLGSVAKLNDVDSQIEVVRTRKSMLATVTQTKSKDGPECAPISIEMKRFELPGFRDSAGQPLATLVARDGALTAAVAALNPEGNAAMILELLQGAEGLMAEAELKAAFREAKIVAGVKPESADKAYRRAMQALRDDGCVRDIEGEIALT